MWWGWRQLENTTCVCIEFTKTESKIIKDKRSPGPQSINKTDDTFQPLTISTKQNTEIRQLTQILHHQLLSICHWVNSWNHLTSSVVCYLTIVSHDWPCAKMDWMCASQMVMTGPGWMGGRLLNYFFDWVCSPRYACIQIFFVPLKVVYILW